MSRLVCYSLFAPNSGRGDFLGQQLLASIRSLRVFNKSIPILLCIYNEMPELEEALAEHDITIRRRGSYKARLSEIAGRASEVLAQYPVLHKFLNFDEINTMNPEQLLVLDSDTLFFADVEEIFSKYLKADCYAREEYSCKRSAEGYDSEYVDEDFLAKIAASENVALLPPFNTGVLLFNNKSWRRMQLVSIFILYVWRFSIWMALNRRSGAGASDDGANGIDFLREHFYEFVTKEDESRALPFPCGNRWIIEQISIWLTLGHIPGLTYQDFKKDAVLQGAEFTSVGPFDPSPIVCHYYSGNTKRFASWMLEHATTTNLKAVALKLPR